MLLKNLVWWEKRGGGSKMNCLTTVWVVKLWRTLYTVRKHELIYRWHVGRANLNSIQLDSSIAQPGVLSASSFSFFILYFSFRSHILFHNWWSSHFLFANYFFAYKFVIITVHWSTSWCLMQYSSLPSILQENTNVVHY